MSATQVALVLVGGFGTRLRSEVSDRPKALARIHGRPFLYWQIQALAAQGIRHLVLCTHYMSEMIEAAFPAGPQPGGITIAHSREPTPLGTGGALRLALDAAPPEEGHLLAVNGDTFCAFDMNRMAKFHAEQQAQATILLTQVDDVTRYGAVDADAQGRVTAFREKAAPGGPARPGWINAGVYLLSRPWLAAIPGGAAVSIERDIFPAWIGKGLSAWRGGSRFLDIGTPESYRAAERYLADNLGGGRQCTTTG